MLCSFVSRPVFAHLILLILGGVLLDTAYHGDVISMSGVLMICKHPQRLPKRSPRQASLKAP